MTYLIIERTTVDYGISCNETRIRSVSSSLKMLFHELQKDLNQYDIFEYEWRKPENKKSNEIIKLSYCVVERFWLRDILRRELTIIKTRLDLV